MPDRLVHFATNRIFDGAKAEFGMVPSDPPGRLLAGKVTCKAFVDPAKEAIPGTPVVAKSEDPDEGLIDTLGSWLQLAEQQQGIALLYVHGFNHTFPAAVARTAALAAWLEAGGSPPIVPMSFSWPSNGMGSQDGYKDDQKDAARSGFALARLISAIGALRPKTPPVYLAHSMGARVTRCAMPELARIHAGAPPLVFRQAFIFAGDDEEDVLDQPWRAQAPDETVGALRPIAQVARHVTIAVNRDDGTVWLVSGIVNQGRRLGTSGPRHAGDLPANVAVVDYSPLVGGIADKGMPPTEAELNWIGHQYHRNDKRVRADWIAALVEDVAPGKVSTRRPAKVDPTIAIQEIAGRFYVKG